MKNVSMEVKFEVAVEIAGLFDINVEGMDQETLVNAINEKINAAKTKSAPAGKWYENEELVYNNGDKVDVVSGWAAGRIVQIEKPSAKKNAFKGYLVNPKTGELQGTLVTVDEQDIKPFVAKEETPVVEEQAV